MRSLTNKEDTFMVSFLFLSKGIGDSNSDGGTSVNKTVRWTVFSEGREARAEQGQIAKQYASPMAHQTKNCLCTTCKSNPTKLLYHTEYMIVKKIFQNHKNFCLFPKNKYNCFNKMSIEKHEKT